ncbi:MAG: DUF5678 domain-containing protein [Patescibacteria group bacterium]
MKNKYSNRWVALSIKDKKIIKSAATFKELYARLDDKRKDVEIKFLQDPRLTISP